MKRRRLLASIGLVAVFFSLPELAQALDNGNGTPAKPISTGSAAILNNNLEAGAGGLYAPLGPGQAPTPRQDPRNPLTVPPSPNPQGKSCPENTAFHVLHAPRGPGVPSGQILRVVTIYPPHHAGYVTLLAR